MSFSNVRNKFSPFSTNKYMPMSENSSKSISFILSIAFQPDPEILK